MIDVREVKLNLRYPESRQEDITDAFMRGYTNAVEIGNKAIEKLELENAALRTQLADVTESMGRVEERCAKLRELLQRTWDAFHDATAREFITVKNELRELGVEVS